MSPLRPRYSVCIIGLGYVGLATAACFASRRFNVTGVDIDQIKLDRLRRGLEPFHEEGLMPLLKASLRSRMLTLTSSFDGLKNSDFVFITVGTPSKVDGGIDTRHVEAATREVGRQMGRSRGRTVVVMKSTVIPGTTRSLVLPILERESGKKAGRDFGLGVNPEFLHEGAAIHETFHPDALVVGGLDRASTEAILRLYRRFYGRLPRTLSTTTSNAEMMKYAINAGRAAQVSFVNTIANLATKIPDCDMDDIRKGLEIVAGMDPRYLGAGIGFGGSCLGKDSRAIASLARLLDVDDAMIQAALKVNHDQVSRTVGIAEDITGPLADKRVSVLGLAFKGNTDDIRESVAISLVQVLILKGASVSVFDPKAMENARRIIGNRVRYAESAKGCLEGSDCCIVATGWDEFKKLRPTDFKRLMRRPVIVDGRRIFRQSPFRDAGLRIATIGTGPPGKP